jgi:AhpD family alkylhydroperoxidase
VSEAMHPKPTRAHAERRHALAPAADDAFKAFQEAVFADGALDKRTKQLIAVAVAHVTQCPWCIQGHVKAARRAGASDEQVMEAIWVAAEMRAGAAFAHSLIALEAMGGAGPRDG